MNNVRKLFLLSTIFLPTLALVAQGHPNFTGTWKLDVAKSEMGSGGPTKLVVVVDHKDPVFKYLVQGIAAGGQFEESETFTTDGKTSRDSHGVNVKASWDGAELVAVGTADDGSMVYLSRLTLSPDGKTITRVFTQKDDRELRHEIYEKQ